MLLLAGNLVIAELKGPWFSSFLPAQALLDHVASSPSPRVPSQGELAQYA